MRFLVIDDEFTALHRMMAMLKPFGHCDAATHGQQALDMFCAALKEGAPYNLITVDIEMPDMDGVELLRQIRSQERLARVVPTRIIMVTADNTEANVRRAIGSHCDAYLIKPVDKDTLRKKLARLKIVSNVSVKP